MLPFVVALAVVVLVLTSAGMLAFGHFRRMARTLRALVGLVAVYVVVLITRLRITKFGFPAQELGDPCLILKNLRHAPFEY
jgi:hypothetical protein